MAEGKKIINKKLKAFILISAILALIAIGVHQGAGDIFKWRTYDIFIKKIGGEQRKPHKDVILLDIDENSMKYGEARGIGRWPWKRIIYPEILNFINMTNPPKAIFFDIAFAESDPTPGSDKLFAASLQNLQNVYHNMIIRKDIENKKATSLPPDIAKHFAIKVNNASNIKFSFNKEENYTIPLPCLRVHVACDTQNVYKEMVVADKTMQKDYTQLHNAEQRARGLAVASFAADEDGRYRRGRLLFKYGDNYYPSLTLAAIMAYVGTREIDILPGNLIKVGSYLIPVDKNGNYLVNYHLQRIMSYSMSGVMESYSQILQGNDKVMINPEVFKDKIVIIGVSAVGGSDLKNTPLSKSTPGPEIHANMISNILLQNHIKQESNWFAYVIMIIMISLSIAIVFYMNNYYIQSGLSVLLYGIYVGISVLLFRYLNYLPQVAFVLGSSVISTGIAMGYMRATEGAEKKKYSKILGNMVDPSIVKEALNDLESLKKGGEKYITAFFSDIASFSTISEKLTSTDLAALLNEYLSAMTIILKKHGGTLDKYIGDAIVGIFNAPVEIENHPMAAVKAALEKIERIEELKEKWRAENVYCVEAQQMHFRIGLNTGLAKVGFMGTNELASYTMMGDTVNLAARLEAAAKDYGVAIMISSMTKVEIENEIFVRKLDAIRVKGKSEPILVFEVINEINKVPVDIRESTTLYEEAFDKYQLKKWDEAIELFKKSMAARGKGDQAAEMLIDRCEYYKESPPPEGWDGVFTRTHK